MKSSLLAIITLALLSGCLEQQQAAPLTPSSTQQALTYQETRPLFWGKIYTNGGKTLYCNRTFGKRHGRDINIEHVFPMSWATKALKCGTRSECRNNSQRFNQIESDMHNLYPSLAEINDARGSMSYIVIKGEKRFMESCDFEIDRNRYKAEPRPAARGEIARAMLYMADTYPELKLYKNQRKLMEQWHRSDPPDQEEKRRNRLIESIQGNNNPYIE